MSAMSEDFPVPTNLTPEQKRRRRLRNWALMIALAIFVIVVYLVALVKMGYYA